MPVRKLHFAPNDFLHAASVVALADTTCGYATMAHLPEGAQSFTTIELKSNHLGTVKEGIDRLRRERPAPGPQHAGVGCDGHGRGHGSQARAVPLHADDPLAEIALRPASARH
jgi:hypothetical protein